MCLATGKANVDPDLGQTYTQFTSLLDANTKLRQQARDAGQRGNISMPLSQVQAQASKTILKEQGRRDDLRAQYAAAETAANDQLKQIAEQQKQAALARQAELARQAQLASQAEAARIAQQQQLAQEQLATNAMSASMRVLGQASPTTGAPTAQTTGSRGRGRVRQSAVTQSLRIGSSSQAPGVGLNIGG
jgi:hypothetical protein